MIRVPHAHLPVAASTHPGMKGKANEDRFAVTAFRLSRNNRTPVLLAVLCDGIGGHRAGEVAAAMAVDRITQQVADSDGSNPPEIMRRAAEEASREIQVQSSADAARRGMGATLACAWIQGRRLFTATVGDSRIFLLRGGDIRQLSVDHTWIQDALDIGLLTPDQVRGHPNAHVIRRYLGSDIPPQVDFRLRLDPHDSDEKAAANQGMLLLPGDRLVLCSDGLSDLVTPEEILHAFQPRANHSAPTLPLSDTRPLSLNGAAVGQTGTPPADSVVAGLIDLANQRGGHDNITLITVAIPAQPTRPIAKPYALPWRWLGLGCAGVLALALLVGAVWVGAVWYQSRPTATPPLLLPATATRLVMEALPSHTQLPATLPPQSTATRALMVAPPTATLTAWPTGTPSASPTTTPSLTPPSAVSYLP